MRFRQVLTNLLANAAKFTDSGEIELSLDIEAERDNQVKLHAAIRDTGIGIPKDELANIFEPFRQFDSSVKRKYGGTGLGLSICKQISNLMDGDVWAESDIDKGSIFHFSAWLGKAEAKEAKRFTSVSLIGKKALIVDDNQANLDILVGTLELVGMRVVALGYGSGAMPALQEALAAEDPFDTCLTDIQMPGVSGYDIAKQIRNPSSQFSNLPLIALSSSMDRDARECETSGFDGFLGKPIRREKLYQMLERIIGEGQGKGKRHEIAREKILTQYSIREDMKHSVSILLVEDHPVNQRLAKLMLTKAGYQVAVANDGKEAVNKYTASPEGFDLIFMDVQMPEMDGIEATKTIRRYEKELRLSSHESPGTRHIPIVAMTAHAMKGDKEKCLEIGMDDYITKPIKREIVFDMLERWVLNKRPL